MPVLAQNYPTRTVRIIVPFTPGGGADIQGRALAQKLTERFGQQVIVDNRPGAATVLATELTAKASADGYTILFVTTTFAINASLRKVPYDIIKDFTPVIHLTAQPNMLAAHPSLPANHPRELIRLARERPGALTYGSAGSGTAAHVSMELMQMMSGAKLTHVPYKGASQGIVDLMSGQIALFVTPPASLLPHIKSGKIKPIAVTTAKRAAAAPNVPTIAEGGLPGYEATAWQGLVAPVGVPNEIVARLNREINGILQLADVRERIAADGAEPVGGSPDAFAAHIRKEHAKWAKVVKASGAKVD
ncbi:MAG: tripartite tricarboxylate transporter substrate binding protein [Burkholderiaceae bacterium]